MKNPKLIFAIVLGVVFCFAGYNLWSYFKEQQAIQLEEDRLAEERRVEREAEEEARRQEAERLRAEQEAARLAERISRARTLERIEEVPQELIDQMNGLSRRYIADHPDEFLTQTFDGRTFGSRTNFEKLIQGGTNTLMLFAAITQDTDLLQALLDIGMDVNAQNEAGYTPLMFAAAYNTPKVVSFLVGQGADISAKAYVQDLTPLHVAALFNPNPDVINALVDAGADLEAVTENPMTPLLLACSDNQNLEVAERLAELGADIEAYSPDGLTAKGLCEQRVRGEGDQYIKITDEVNGRILGKL